MLIALMMQVATLPLPAIDFDLADVARKPDCTIDASTDVVSDIVICASRGDSKRLPPLDPNLYADAHIEAKATLFGGTGSVNVDQVDFGNGQVSKRLMFNWKLPF